MTFLKRNYIKLLLSGLIGTSALLISAMTDSLIAGRFLSAEGLTAVSLASPYFSVSSFLCSMVLAGADISINQSLGAKDTDLADRQFSYALFSQIIIGICFSVISVLLLKRLPALLGGGDATAPLMHDYLSGIAPFSFIFPISAFLSSITYYDGDVKTAVIGQLTGIASNIILSIYMAGFMGIGGIALATVLSSFISSGVFIIHFITKKCPFRVVFHYDIKEVARMAKIGLPGISAYLFYAIAITAVNNYIGHAHGEYTLYLFAVSNTLTSAFTNITGAAGEAVSPLAALYYGEKNDLMLHRLIKLALKCVLILSVIAVAPVYLFPEAICRLYSVAPDDIFNVTRVLKMFTLSLFLSGIDNLLVIYYMVIKRTAVAFTASLLRCNMLFTLSFVALGTLLPDYLWLGVTLSEVMTLTLILIITTALGRRKNLMPLFLLNRERESKIHIWDFQSSMTGFMDCAAAAEKTLLSEGFSEKTALNTCLLIEETGVLLSEYKCTIEVTLITDGDVELIVRDTSPQWDIANADNKLYSFDQYAALQILNKKAKKQFFRTIGCNKLSFITDDTEASNEREDCTV